MFCERVETAGIHLNRSCIFVQKITLLLILSLTRLRDGFPDAHDGSAG